MYRYLSFLIKYFPNKSLIIKKLILFDLKLKDKDFGKISLPIIGTKLYKNYKTIILVH